MSGRPCNPGSDLRALWQALLGGVPFPQCGTPDEADFPERGGTISDSRPPNHSDYPIPARRERSRKGPPAPAAWLSGFRDLL